MAPVHSACRLSCAFQSVVMLPVLFVLCVVLHWYHVDSVLTYDRQALFNIKCCMEAGYLENYPVLYSRSQSSSNPPAPECIYQLPCCVHPLRKRRRKRGCRGGVRVRIRRAIVSTLKFLTQLSLDTSYLEGHNLVRRSWDYLYAFHLPVFCDSSTSALPRLRLSRRGVERLNLRQLDFVRLDRNPVLQSHINMALGNARSVCNKTYILNDFYTGRKLDILFLTETWASAGESSVFEELCPPGCCFISTPRCGHVVKQRGNGNKIR
ncbi:uncharacterized protein LOC111190736 [Tachysurus ichikawai]